MVTYFPPGHHLKSLNQTVEAQHLKVLNREDWANQIVQERPGETAGLIEAIYILLISLIYCLDSF